MFAQWLILSCLVTSKGVVFVSSLTQSVATSCHKNEIHDTKSRNIFELTMHSEKYFCKGEVIGIWNFNGKNRSIIDKIRTFEFQVVSSLYTRGPVSLGAWMQPSVTNDHHLWSLHKGKLWRSPQYTLQIDLMCSVPGERLVIQVHLPLCHDSWSPRM